MVVGHSLGAGAAALLAIMLRSAYPHVRCYAFSPPRGLLRYVRVGRPAAGTGPACVKPRSGGRTEEPLPAPCERSSALLPVRRAPAASASGGAAGRGRR